MEALQAIGWLLTSAWNLLAGIKVPGFRFSFATLFVSLFLARLGLRFLSMILGVSIGTSDADLFGEVKQDISRQWSRWRSTKE